MDDTKKTLLSIDIDTAALTQNTANAKAAVKDLTDQLNLLKAAGKDTGPVFNTLSNQLKATTTDLGNTTKALQAYTKALSQKTTAEQADNKAVVDKSKLTTNGDSAAPGRDPLLEPGSAKLSLPQIDTTLSSATPNLSPKDLVSAKAATAAKTGAGSATTSVAVGSTGTGTGTDKKSDKDSLPLVAKDTDDFFKKEEIKLSNFLNGTFKKNQTNVDADIKLEKTRVDNYLSSANTISNLLGKSTEAGKAALFAKKAFSIAEIAINTEQAVSGYVTGTAKAVQEDLGIPFIGEALAAADIAWGVAQVAGAIANGIKQTSNLNAVTIPSVPGAASPTTAKAVRGGVFQSDGNGGYITGPGTGTSDSINAMLSNGESIINARSTEMFAPILSAINQAGGGRAFHMSNGYRYAQGGLFNGSNTLNDGSSDLATTRAMTDMVRSIAASIPRQVLVVEDVQASLQNKVMLQNMSNF